jgi:hypothetical protein
MPTIASSLWVWLFDEETRWFLDDCSKRKGILAKFLHKLLGHADANALAGHECMFVVFSSQIKLLFGTAALIFPIKGNIVAGSRGC